MFPSNTALKGQSSIGALNFANSNGIRFNSIKYKQKYKHQSYKSLKIIDHDILYRIVENEETYLPELDNTYSLFIHNPNNSFEVLYNRLAIIGNDRYFLRDEHDKELERIRNKDKSND